VPGRRGARSSSSMSGDDDSTTTHHSPLTTHHPPSTVHHPPCLPLTTTDYRPGTAALPSLFRSSSPCHFPGCRCADRQSYPVRACGIEFPTLAEFASLLHLPRTKKLFRGRLLVEQQGRKRSLLKASSPTGSSPSSTCMLVSQASRKLCVS